MQWLFKYVTRDIAIIWVLLTWCMSGKIVSRFPGVAIHEKPGSLAVVQKLSR